MGSVKSNIGHLEASAGIAGLIKSILVLKTGVIPPQLNLIDPKPSLKLDERNIKVSELPISDHLFQPFYRLKTGNEKQKKGEKKKEEGL